MWAQLGGLGEATRQCAVGVMLLKSNAGYHTEIAPQQTNKKEHVATNAAFFCGGAHLLAITQGEWECVECVQDSQIAAAERSGGGRAQREQEHCGSSKALR